MSDECEVCGLLVTNLGDHLRERHAYCHGCRCWVGKLIEHKVACQVCHVRLCPQNLDKHLHKHHLHCSCCDLWVNHVDYKFHKVKTCNFCGKEFCRTQLAKHKQMHHYSCGKTCTSSHLQVCRFCSRSVCNIAKHLKTDHYQCPLCKVYADEEKNHHRSPNQSCPFCPDVPICNFGLHLLKHHYKCASCKRWYASAQLHPPEREYCERCNVHVCSLSYHLSVFVTCRDPNVPIVGVAASHATTQLSADKKPNYVYVKCQQPDCVGRLCPNCYCYPFGILDK